MQEKKLPWSERMAESVIKRNPEPWMIDFRKTPKWEYTQGLALKAIMHVWLATGKDKYFQYVKAYYDQFIKEDGTIKLYKLENYNIDRINPGKPLFRLYHETGEEKFKKAIFLLRNQMKTHPRTSEGGFWHKKIYPHQMWLDGLYMGSPFLAEFAQTFDEPALFDPPEISDVKATPMYQIIGGWVNISCNITDVLGVDTVSVNISYPNGTILNQTMNSIPSGLPYTDLYYYNNNYSTIGIYSYFIWTRDTQGNQNVSQNHTFTIGRILNITDLTLSWNLISIPFNKSISKTDLIVNYNGTNYTWYDAINASIINEYLFGWNRTGQSYTFTDTLQPGYGYWIYANDDCKIKVFTINTSYNSYITNLSSYWNIMGIPINYSINKTDVIIYYNNSQYNWTEAVLADLVNDYIFGWNRTYHSYEFISTFEPGYSYWLYAYTTCILKH